ncbi:MAG: ParM/StbA family protein [Clostridium sp.]
MSRVITDIGNNDFKVFSQEIGTFSFSSKYHTNFEPNEEAFERIELDEVITYIGVGELSQEYIKVEKECIIPQVLYAISTATKSSEVDLVLLLPISQLPQRSILIKMFKGQIFNFKVNGKFRSIHVNKMCVLPECAISISTIPDVSRYQLIIDIGSRTTQYALFEDRHLIKNGTEKLGVLNLYDEVKKVLNSKGYSYEIEDIEMQIKRGAITIDKKISENFLKRVINKIKTQVSLKDASTTFIGGGSLVLKNLISQIPDVEISDNCIYANVLGANEIAKGMWG